MGMRELLILLLGLAVVSVILRGLYVAMQARRGQIRLAIDKNIPQDVDLEELELAELPSGGARVVKRSLAQVNQLNTLQKELDLDSEREVDESVPILLDTVKINNPLRNRGTAERREQTWLPRDAAVLKEEDGEALMAEALTEAEGTWEEDTGSDTVEFTEADERDAEDLPEALIDSPESLDEAEFWMEEEAEEGDRSPGDPESDAYYEDRDDYQEEDFEDEFAEERTRQEPLLDFDDDLEEDFGDFSITAGERIGGPTPRETGGLRKRFSAMAGQERSARPARKESLFARFGKKDGAEVAEVADDEAAESDHAPEQESLQEYRQEREEASAITADAPRSTTSGEQSVRPSQAASARNAQSGVADFHQARETRRPVAAEAGGAATQPKPRSIEPSEVLVVNVMSREGGLFRGPALLQVLTSAGLKHGEMNIFHRHLHNDSDGPILFSVANILNPGTFEMDNMEEFTTRGVSLFLAMPAPINNREAFENMLKTAQQIRAALDGELRDDHRHLMTAQTIEHYRQRITDYELRKLKAAQAQS
jgi:cell division protein ZipA